MRRSIVVTALAVLTSAQAMAQQPQKGTWELGGFGRYNWYDNSFNQIDSTRKENSWGGGLRVGYFFSPRFNLELDGSANATDLNFPGGPTSVGLTYWPFHVGINYNAPLSEKFMLHLGPRANFNAFTTSEETDAFTDEDWEGSDWGVGAIAGFRFKFSDTWSARLDGTVDWIPSPINDATGTNTMMAVQLGLSAFLGGKCRDKLDSIRIEPKEQNITVGDRAGLRITGYECDGDVVDATGSSTARLTSGQGTLAGMSFTATQAGCVDVEVSNPGARQKKTDTARICVQERQAPPPARVTLDRCELNPATANVPPGETVNFRVTGFYSDGTSRELETATLNADGGTISGRAYTVPLAPGTYTVVAQCGDGRAARASITVRALTYTIRTLFGFNATTLTNQVELDSLRFIAEELKKYPNLQLVVYGHTDWVGSTAFNERLGMRRIQAVLDTLVSFGVDRARVDSWTKISFGECQPIADNRTRAGRAANRRVALWDVRSAPATAGSGRCEERP